MRSLAAFFSVLIMLLVAVPAAAARLTLTVGAASLPQGSVEQIAVSTDLPLNAILTVASSDPAAVAVPPVVTVTIAGTSFPVVFQNSGSSTITVAAPDGTTATTTLTVTPGAVLTALAPAPILAQVAGTGGQSVSVPFLNSGSTAFNGSFPSSPSIDASPASLALAPGTSASVTFTGRGVAAGEYVLKIPLPQLKCCPVAAQSFDVRLESVERSAGGAISPSERRVDVAAPANSFFAPGSVLFTNSSSFPVTGRVVSDVAWLQPLTDGALTIAAGSSEEVPFALNRDARPDVMNPVGSEVGTLSFVYATSGANPTTRLLDSGAPTIVAVTVVDTITLPTSPAPIPPLAPGEVALLMPGLGNVLGSVGHFVSDVSLFNRLPQTMVNNLRFFFAPADGTSPYGAVLRQLLPHQAIRFADVTGPFGEGLYGGAGKLGLLQLRLSDASQVAVAASVFNSSNPAGTYGTGILPMRSDRAVRSGEKLYLVGLRADAQSHTNFYIQEAAGLGAQVAIRFLDAHGQLVGERTESLGPWSLRILGFVVPAGSVSAELRHVGGSGTFVAYATPVDISGDTWVVADWPRQYGVSNSSSAIIPVAGVVHGAASTYFRTDISIMNTGATAVTGTLRFISRDFAVIDRAVTIEAAHTFVSEDVVSTLFNATTDTAGFLLFLPGSGSTQITSRTFSTRPGLPGSYGTAVPSLTPAYALRNGDRRQITAIEDARRAAVMSATPATYRTNFGLVETSGAAATVRVTLRYVVPGTLTVANVVATRDYQLAPNQYMQLSVRDVFGSGVVDADVRNATLDFSVVAGSGAVVPYVSSVDNGTGDSILRVD